MALISEGKSGVEELSSGLPDIPEKQAPLLAVGALFAERYEIEAVLGQGALGFTYRAKDRETQSPVVVKILRLDRYNPASTRKRFVRFMTLVEGIEHRNLAKVIAYGQQGDEDFIVREFVDGQSLDNLIMERKERQPRQPTFGFEEVLNILIEVSRALDAARGRTYHGGLAPSNIIITDDAVKVTDLALARIFQPAQFSSLQIYHGNGYYYLAPEYDRSGSKIDERADSYAAAVIAYEMLTGDIPRTPLVPPSVANSKLSPGIDGPFLKALDLNPESRQESLRQFVEQLCGVTGMMELLYASPVLAAVPVPPAPLEPVSTLMLEPLAPPPTADLLDDSAQKVQAAKSRLTQAIERQLRAHGAATPESTKTPVLPNAPTVLGNGQAKVGASTAAARNAVRPSTTSEWTWWIYWPWALVAAAIAFTLFMWSGFFLSPPSSHDVAHVAAPETPVKAAPVKPVTPKNHVAVSHPMTTHASAPVDDFRKPGRLPEKPPEKPTTKPPSSKLAAKAAVAAAAGSSVAAAPRCPSGMVYVPGGTFMIGTEGADRDFLELSARKVSGSAVCIDQYEWPNRRGVKPQTAVSFADAVRSCASVGKRLCSELEWERACRGPEGHAYPYGSAFSAKACNTKDRIGTQRSVAPSGSYPACRNGWGVYDMSGNVAEWTSGQMSQGKTDRMVRGGSSKSSDWAARCSYRKNRLPEAISEDLGFRCCSEAQ